MHVRILQGDVLERLADLDDESIHCVVTSPPYWGLRDYGVDGQLGLERAPDDHVARMVEVFAEVRRVLRSDGVCWVNYGDAYASSGLKGSGGKDNEYARMLSRKGVDKRMKTFHSHALERLVDIWDKDSGLARITLESMTRRELDEIAREVPVPGFSTYRKAGLVKAILFYVKWQATGRNPLG